MDLRVLHEDLARVVLAGRGVAEVLAEITAVARRALPGSEATSITLIRGGKPFTAAHDGHLALDGDALQYERGDGPCLDAARSGEVVVVTDTRTEHRWSDYAKAAAACGVGSSLSVPLPSRSPVLGALNNYSTRPDAFSEHVASGAEIASWVGLAVGNALAAATEAEETTNLRAAMISRAVIEQAKGILMERHQVGPDQAFDLLVRSSQRTGVKLRDVAEQLARAGTTPDAPPV